MAVTKYTLRRPALSAHRFARIFDEHGARGNGGAWSPPTTVEEGADELLLTAELPGLTEADISIELENDVLTIKGEKTEQRTEGDEERKYHLWERRYGAFQRSFTLPRTVSGDEIRAHFEHGVLKVHLPKVPEAKGRKIEIQTK